MGLFRRLRAQSSAGDGSTAAPTRSSTVRRSPSTNLLNVQYNSNNASRPDTNVAANPPVASGRASMSSVTTSSSGPRTSILPWRREKKPSAAAAAAAAATASPSPAPTASDHSPSDTHHSTPSVRARTPSLPMTSIRPPRHTDSPSSSLRQPFVSNGRTTPTPSLLSGITHDQETTPTKRAPSRHSGHERTVSANTDISMSSVDTRSKTSSSSAEWKKEGGILGTLNFDGVDDWSGLSGGERHLEVPVSGSPKPSYRTTLFGTRQPVRSNSRDQLAAQEVRPVAQSKPVKEPRKDAKELKEPDPPKDTKFSSKDKAAKEPKLTKEAKLAKEPKEPKEPKTPKDSKPPKESSKPGKDSKSSRDTHSAKDSKDSKDSKSIKDERPSTHYGFFSSSKSNGRASANASRASLALDHRVSDRPPPPTPSLDHAPSSPSGPPSHAKRLSVALPAAPLAYAASPIPSPSAEREEEIEEIRVSEADENLNRFAWKGRMQRPRRSSRTGEERAPTATEMGKQRPPLAVQERAPPLRRPSSSIFHNPFHRSQSRASLGVSSPAEVESPPVEAGSFQLKAFRHISGASDAEGGFEQYLSQVTKRSPAASQRNSAVVEEPLTPPRARPPSAAGSVDSQRVSIAQFRKGIRRASSSMLDMTDDDDDIPLSVSRAQLRENHIKSNSSAVSLTEAAAPQMPAVSVSPASPTPEAVATGNSNSLAAPNPTLGRPTSAYNMNHFVVRGVKSTRTSTDDKPDRQSPTQPSSPASDKKTPTSPLREGRPSSPLRDMGPYSPISEMDSRRPAPIRTTSLGPAPTRTTSLPLQSPIPLPAGSPFADAKNNARSAFTPSPSLPPKSAHRSPPPPAPRQLYLPEAQDPLQGIKLPPRPDEMDDEPLRAPEKNRYGALSPTSSPVLASLSVLDEGVRRISGLWNGEPALEVPPCDRERRGSEHEDSFDPDQVEASFTGSDQGADNSRRRDSTDGLRLTLQERLARTTSAALPMPSTASSSSSPVPQLFIPLASPMGDSGNPLSPSSDRTVSPILQPPKITEAPVPPPSVPHSSFGRVPRKSMDRHRAEKGGWMSSSDDEEAAAARKPAKKSAPPPQPPRERVPSRVHIPAMEEIDSGSDEEPLTQLRKKGSRQSLASIKVPIKQPTPILKRPSRSSLHGGGGASSRASVVNPRQSVIDSGRSSVLGSVNDSSNRTTVVDHPHSRSSMIDTNLKPSTTTWSLSSSPSPTMSPGNGSDDLSGPPSRSQSRQAANDRLNRQRSRSADKLRAPPPVLSNRSPRGDIGGLARQTASPASSQSGLTGDSSVPQPQTPGSLVDPTNSRRSWAESNGAGSSLRPRTASASERTRPQTQFDMNGFAYGQPPVDMAYAAHAAQQQLHIKQQIQQQWMAAASRYFDDYWERASNASTAQTMPMPFGGPPTQSYGYSYQPGPASMGVGYGQGFSPNGFPQGYPGYSPMGFPPPMPPGMMAMGAMPGMPANGSMYSYGPPAQSVFGGEFGPPVAGFALTGRDGNDSAHSSPRQRDRRMSGATDLGGRPVSVAANGNAGSGSSSTAPNVRDQRARAPSRPQAPRRSSVAVSEITAPPPSSWRRSGGGIEEFDATPRAKRVTNAS